MSSLTQYYQILGLQPNASPDEVKQAYRKLARTWHPDRFFDPQQKQQAEEEIKKINQAYEILKNRQPTLDRFTNIPGVSVQRSQAEAFYSEGVRYARQERDKEAIDLFSQAIRLNPNYLEAYQYRGFLFAKLGYEHRASADFRKATILKLELVPHPSSRSPDSESSSAPPSTSSWKCTRTLMAHSRKVTAVAVSRDGKFFATGSFDRTIKLWQLSSEQAITTLKGHSDAIHCLAISPNGKLLASGSADKTIRLWNLKTGQVSVLGNWFSKHSEEVLSLAISPDGKKLVSGSADKTVKIWQLNEEKELHHLTGYGDRILSVAISPDGKKFATGGLEKNLRITNLITGKLIRSIRGNSGLLSVAFSPDGSLIAGGGFDRAIRIWKVKTREEVLTVTGHLDSVSVVAFSPDGETLISGSLDGKIKLWHLGTGQELDTLTGHLDGILSLAIAPDGKTIISGSIDKTIRIWRR